MALLQGFLHHARLNMQTHKTLSFMHSRLSFSNLMQTFMAIPYNPIQSFYKETKYFHLHHVSFTSKTWTTHFHARTHAKIKPQTPCFYNKSLRHLHKTPCKALKNKTIPMHKLTARKTNLLY